MPFVSPATAIGLAEPVIEMLAPPAGVHVVVYVIGKAGHVAAGGVNPMLAWLLPAVAVTPVGAAGANPGVT